MKNFFLASLLLVITQFSCDTKQDEPIKKETVVKSKYQMELVEIGDSKSYYSIVLDKTTGTVFVGENNSNWYEATHEQPLPKSKENRYAIKVRTTASPKGIVPEIILFDEVTSDIYIYVVNNVANFYSVMSPSDISIK
jgi:hypothetical protein